MLSMRGSRGLSQLLEVPIEAGPRSAEFPRGRITSVYFRDPDGSLLEFLSYH